MIVSIAVVQTKAATREEERVLHAQDELLGTMILVAVVVETMTMCRYLLVLVPFLFFCYHYSPHYLFLLGDASFCDSLFLFSLFKYVKHLSVRLNKDI